MDEMSVIEKRIKSGINYRSLILEVKTEEENTEPSYIVEGYATTFNEPYDLWGDDEVRVKEQVSDSAFKNCEMNDVIFQYDHQGRVYARTGNGTLELTEDTHGLKVRANLGGTEEGRKLYEEIKGGYTNKMSFGFTVTGEDVSQISSEDEKRVYLRTITDIGRLFDVSAVSLPANDGTEISARSFFDTEVSELVKADAEKRAAEEAQERAEEEAKKMAEIKAREERERLLLELSFSLE